MTDVYQKGDRSRWSAMLLVPLVLVLVLVLIPALDARTVRAATPVNNPGTVFFPLTGHNVAGDFIAFWHENGGLERLGYPVSEEVTEGSHTRQYFERGLVEYIPGGGLTVGRIGAEAVRGRHETAFQPRTRNDFGSDRGDRRFFPDAGHGISGAFATYWNANGGVRIFGYPVSEPLKEAVGEKGSLVSVQYFERARMDLVGASVQVSNLGREHVQKRNLGLSSVAMKRGAIEYSTSIWPKWIDVNLTTQHLVAYEGNTIAQQYDITSGEPANQTNPGTFHIFAKLKSEHMKGPDYDIPNVPWTMYYQGGGYAIHGAPWRAVYGPGTERNGSHGCVNSPVDQVAKLYQWAPLGTTVIIHF